MTVQAGFAIGSPSSPWRRVSTKGLNQQVHKRPVQDFLGYRRLSLAVILIYSIY